MYDITSATSNLTSAFNGVGEILSVVFGGVLVGLIALIGLGYGVRKLYKTIFNYPGGFGYNPALGSGISRFKRGRRNASGGANLLA